MSRFAIRDPLLLLGRVIVILAQGLMAIATLALAIAIAALPFARDQVTQAMARELDDAGFVFPMGAVEAGLACALVAVVLIYLFLRNLRRIIDTVGDGDPFVPANARRLTAMAWLMLAAQGVTIVLAAIGYRLASQFQSADVHFEGYDLDLGSFVLVIVLFILARVFREGARLRAELEGTV